MSEELNKFKRGFGGLRNMAWFSTGIGVGVSGSGLIEGFDKYGSFGASVVLAGMAVWIREYAKNCSEKSTILLMSVAVNAALLLSGINMGMDAVSELGREYVKNYHHVLGIIIPGVLHLGGICGGVLVDKEIKRINEEMDAKK